VAGPEFFETRMGKEFYMRDIPEIRKQLKRIANALGNLHNDTRAFTPDLEIEVPNADE